MTLQQQLTANRNAQQGFAQAIIDASDNQILRDGLIAEYLKLVEQAAKIEAQLIA